MDEIIYIKDLVDTTLVIYDDKKKVTRDYIIKCHIETYSKIIDCEIKKKIGKSRSVTIKFRNDERDICKCLMKIYMEERNFKVDSVGLKESNNMEEINNNYEQSDYGDNNSIFLYINW